MKRCPNCNGSIVRLGHKEKPFLCQSCNKWFSNEEVTPKQTNGDRIRKMGDIELANFLSGLTNGCVNCPMYYSEEDDECIKHCNSVWQEWVRKEQRRMSE